MHMETELSKVKISFLHLELGRLSKLRREPVAPCPSCGKSSGAGPLCIGFRAGTTGYCLEGRARQRSEKEMG